MMKVKDKKSENFSEWEIQFLRLKNSNKYQTEKKKKNQDKLYAKRQKSSQRVKKHNYLEGNMNETKNWLLDQKIV